MTFSWIDSLTTYARDGMPAILLTVLDARGSTPREAGAKMVVSARALSGTIGGGRLEHECVLAARALLEQKADAPVLREFPLGPVLGQCCGGHVRVLLEPVLPPAWQIALFGAGHVGQALVKLFSDLPCRVRWIDARAEAFPDGLPTNIVKMPAERPEAEIADLPKNSFVLVMTHDHALDYRIISACLAREQTLRFVGLIGSATKAARFRSRLAREGWSPAAVARVVCPIGLQNTGGKLPAEIAISVAAQLLQVRDTAVATVALGGNVLAMPAPGCGDAQNCNGCREATA
jgi:xanthine dehydrogenase accessory factor